ncbi:YabP/YqfC family sporulation protein [Alicyclobacillus kakegawensis]|uniref:YabP/YqfC family sporulation protein n=1 Tax=Alicyclobacillus kakegawensis TaxID=392012 RepID=UPI0008363A9E|nr:YabP/YqfC family sporulation protein [Alicyclobacillus kakegawensis]
MRKLRKAWKRRASEWLSLPPATMAGVPRVLIVADEQVVMENIVGLERVDESEIVVDIGEAHVRLAGEGFEVTLAVSGEIHVRGRVHHIEFIRRRGNER